MTRLRVMLEVVAGVIPGQPIKEYSKQWEITSAEWYGPEDRRRWNPTIEEIEEEQARRIALLRDRYKMATDYANEIMDPVRVNWVRVDWIWL